MRRSVRTLIFLRAVPVLLIKVLADLETLRAAFFYRHLGPHGPKEDPLLQPEPLRRAQIALILAILIILAILLQTTGKETRYRKTDGASRWPGATSEKAIPLKVLKDLHVYSTLGRKEP